MVHAHLLGTAQDGGVPHAGCECLHCRTAWNDPSKRRLPASIGLQDTGTEVWFLVDATPALPEQMHRMSMHAPAAQLQGILLTHLHMGHYGGLLHLGREAMNARSLPLYATRSSIAFLMRNEPWKSLLTNGNLVPRELTPDREMILTPSLRATPIAVPHRAEFSDTMAFILQGPASRLLYLPDIDRWDTWDRNLRAIVDDVDVALLDATFFSPDELPGRAIAEIPHPLVADTIARLNGTACDVRLIHLNHSNPLNHDGPERDLVARAGFHVGEEGDTWTLG